MNMPLRHLLYFDELVKDYINGQKKLKDADLYQRAQIGIPRPKFIVLYNGDETVEDETILQLSDSYFGEGESALNLTVKVYNVNKGSGSTLLEKCPTLHQYSQLVEIVKSYRKKGTVGHRQMQEIVDRCIEEGILVDFMKEYGRRGIDLLCCEMTEAEYLERERKFAREEGLEEGIAEGRERVLLNMLRAGMNVEQAAELAEVPAERARQLAEEL